MVTVGPRGFDAVLNPFFQAGRMNRVEDFKRNSAIRWHTHVCKESKERGDNALSWSVRRIVFGELYKAVMWSAVRLFAMRYLPQLRVLEKCGVEKAFNNKIA